MNVRTVGRVAVTGVWLHQGVWKKVVSHDVVHTEIVQSVPGLTPRGARLLSTTVGFAEAGLAAWVLSGRRTRLAAGAQTALVVGMNTSALLFARAVIPKPARLIARNAAFLAAVWSLA